MIFASFVVNILIVEDDPQIASFLKRIISKISHVFAIDVVHCYEDAIELLVTQRYDMLLLDIRLGHNDQAGIDLCKLVRKRDQSVVIIVITSYHGTNFLRHAFRGGANDYITKPFSLTELQLRVERWASMVSQTATMNHIVYNELEYQVRQHDFCFKGKTIKLSKQQKFLLLQFLKSPEALISGQRLEEKIWGDNFGSHNLRSNIQMLRDTLEKEAGIGHWIQTRRGEGYMLLKSSS